MSPDQRLIDEDSESSGPLHSHGSARAGKTESSTGVSTLKLLSSLLGGVIILSIIALVALLDHTGEMQDELAANESRSRFLGLMKLQSRQIAVHALDYASWDEAISSLLVDKSDAWWKSNAGDYAADAFDLSFSMVVDGWDRLIFAANGKNRRQDFDGIPAEPSVQAIFKDARRRPSKGTASEVAATGIVRIKEHLHLVTAVKFRTEKADSRPNPDPEALLIFAQSLSGTVLPITAEIMGKPGLSLTGEAGPEEVSVPLSLADGSAAAVAHWAHTRPGKQMVAAVLPWVAGLLLVILIAVIYAALRTVRLTRDIRNSAEQLRVLSLRFLEVQETERRRVAHELHDELGQSLTAIKINLLTGQSRQGVPPGPLDLENVRIVDAALQQVRRIALALRPSMLDDLGLESALGWLAKAAAVNRDLEVDFQCSMDQQRLPGEVETACFRIVQEALTNVRRHALASKVSIRLDVHARQVHLAISDNGIGIWSPSEEGSSSEPSLGLLGMKERAASIGGSISVQSQPDQGTTVELRCNLPEPGTLAT